MLRDSLGNKFDLYYPTNLGAGGFSHPIITWGNGTNGSAAAVDYLLRHFASWGFVIVATEDKNTGAGQTILDAANYMVGQNGNSASIFYHKLNVSQIGAVGHSQGAGGVINAAIKSGGLIKTVIPLELPAQGWCILNLPTCADSKNLTSGSVFFVDGSADTLISPPTQPPGTLGEQSIAAYYNAVPAGVGKVKGTLIGPNHNDVTGQPDCKKAAFPCVNGVYGYLGYPTAWLMYQLQGMIWLRAPRCVCLGGQRECFQKLKTGSTWRATSPRLIRSSYNRTRPYGEFVAQFNAEGTNGASDPS